MILTRHDYNGLLFDSPKSLRTTDQCLSMSLLKVKSRNCLTSLKEFHQKNSMSICEINNVLTKEECTDIFNASSICNFQDMDSKYDPKKDRNNSRLLVPESGLARHLWSRIKAVLLHVTQDNDITLCPLRFDVLRDHWEFCELNEGVRVNRYTSETGNYFAPHKDAQYCPSGDKRSFLSLILYLNEGFQGGETHFCLPKIVKQEAKAMITEEEIEAAGGLQNACDNVNIVPRTGFALYSVKISCVSLLL